MICENCHTEFTPKMKTQIYCSRVCKNKHAGKRARIKRVKNKNPTYRYICDFCHREFYAPDKRVYKTKYCSNDCRFKSRRKYIDIPDCLERSERKLDKNIGYVRIYCPMHREANTRGYVYEHRIIAEQKIGRDLLPGEVVHHINGIRWDNRSENLQVMTSREHGKLSNKRK